MKENAPSCPGRRNPQRQERSILQASSSNAGVLDREVATDRIAVVTDSASCLPREFVEKYTIKIVPISIIVDGHVYRDGVDIAPEEVYQIVASSKALPTTTAPSPGEFLEAFQEVSEWANRIICVTLNSDLSMVHNSAMLAKRIAQEAIPDVTVNIIDSRNAGGAQGFVALAAARAAASGESFEQATDIARNAISQVHMLGVLDTLHYLAKAGRVPLGRLVSWGSSLFRIKPILVFSHEGIKLLERTRSKPRAIRRLLSIMEERTKGKPVYVNVMHADVPEEAEVLKSGIESQFECLELHVTDFPPTMGVHTGPGVIAVAFYADDDGDPVD